MKIMPLDKTILMRARTEGVEVELADLIDSTFLAADATLHDVVPEWLVQDLTDQKLQLSKDRIGRWILGPTDD